VTFASEFPLAGPALEEAPALQSVLGKDIAIPKPGLYAGGEVAVLTVSSKDLLQAWPEEIRVCTPLLATAFGDLFVWSRAMGCVTFLETQTGDLEPIDADARWFLDEFLTKPEIRERVLHRERLKSVSERCGALGWLECYVLEPWESMGGNWISSNCRKGRLPAYLDAVGKGQKSVA
jgi:hypothetical protein